MNLPRTDSTKDDIVDAFTVLMYVIGETGRSTIRAHLLKNADVPDFAKCLRVMNDVERVMEWKEKQNRRKG